MDEEKGHEVAFVQYSQAFHNLTNNDIYGNSCQVFRKLEFPGFDANGWPCYIGTRCFHRLEAFSGKKYDETCKVDWKRLNHMRVEESASVLEATCKFLQVAPLNKTHPGENRWG
ncbi:cellulose synthase like E1 [Hibiscus trionum]|uniref:Cellulose synthase like E1 n=1 Tax=Hibiscus trionum TaxID=183268 RepID=A0A9W7HZI1_HIBTR|nr:cellulose synthase like E1 [Hibiscus trionum]